MLKNLSFGVIQEFSDSHAVRLWIAFCAGGGIGGG